MVVGTEHADRTGSDVVIRRSEVETIQSVKKYTSDWQFKTYTQGHYSQSYEISTVL